MDEKIKKKVIIQNITSMIKKSDRFECSADFGMADAVNVNNGMLEHAYNGEVSICLHLYLKDKDGRNDLFVRCATRAPDFG